MLQQAQPSRLKRLLRRFDALFFGAVLLPTLLAALYFGLVASDMYISESRFVVRNPQGPAPSGLSALLQGGSLMRSSDDTYSVHDFMRSRDVLRALDKKLQLQAAYSSPDIDVFNRFPGVSSWDRSFEAFHEHYLKQLGIDYDSTSSISVLRVRAFSGEQAQQINEQLLVMGEELVNTLNRRARQDLISLSADEVRKAEERVKAAAKSLSAFRSDRAVFDPSGQSALQLQAVSKLEQDLIATEAQLAEVRRTSPQNPQVASLVLRVDGLRKAIASEQAKVTGGKGSLSAKTPLYDQLVLEKSFADRQLAGALTALDGARVDAQRKQLYLERLVQPGLPDSAMEPRRLRGVVTVFLLGLMAWGVLSLLLASIREHAD